MRRTTAALLIAAAAALSPHFVLAAPVGDETHRAYDAARAGLLQIRSLVDASGRQSSIGSGFQVDASGLAVTNYHVISEHALEPGTYRLEYIRTDGKRGKLHLLAVDVAHDLAVVKLDEPAGSTLPLESVSTELRQGQRLYAMGNPLDIGFTIVEGTYNGLTERSYSDRFHFTGAINPGMSGGPAVDEAGRVVGINVAKRLDGELVSFLVPVRFSAALIDRARNKPFAEATQAKAEIGRQLLERQSELYRQMIGHGFRNSVAGRYEAPESEAPWFQCWASTNADEVPKPRARVDTTQCSAETDLFIAGDLQPGSVQLRHDHLRSVKLNGFQFASFLSAYYQPLQGAMHWSASRKATPRCHDDFVAQTGGGDDKPLLRAGICARAYRDFDGLYDVTVTAVTQDANQEAMALRLTMEAAPYELALELARDYLGAISWAKR
ncbi:serine protease [Hydrocarboniphaga effusa]|uniref:S1C family serine protease n=1 Tax=Hydrocarboniphaga effusa TaxID=243629 RepID=UPI0031377C87